MQPKSPSDVRAIRMMIYTVIVIIIGLGGTTGVLIWYVNNVRDRSDAKNVERQREICGLIKVLDDSYIEQPPTTQTGKKVAQEVHRYYMRLGCDSK